MAKLLLGVLNEVLICSQKDTFEESRRIELRVEFRGIKEPPASHHPSVKKISALVPFRRKT